MEGCSTAGGGGKAIDKPWRAVRQQNVRLQDVRLQDVRLQDVRLQDVRLPDVRLQDVRLQDVRLQDVGIASAITIEQAVLMALIPQDQEKP